MLVLAFLRSISAQWTPRPWRIGARKQPGWAEDLFFIPAAAAVLVMLFWALSRSTSAGFLQRYHRRAGTSLPADG